MRSPPERQWRWYKRIYPILPDGRFKALTLSFDDGRVQDRRLVALLNRCGIKATFNLNSGEQGENRIPLCEYAPLYAGHEIAAHGVRHPGMTATPLPLSAQQVLEDRRAPELLREVLDTAADTQHCKVIFDPVNLFCAKDRQDKAYQTAHWSRWLEVIGDQLGAVHVKDCRIEADGSKTLLPLGAGDMDYSAIRAFLATHAPAAPLLRDEVILPADTADVRYLRRMTDTV